MLADQQATIDREQQSLDARQLGKFASMWWGSPTDRTAPPTRTVARTHARELRIDKSHRLYPMSRQRRPPALAAASCPVWVEPTERSPRQRLTSPSLVSPPRAASAQSSPGYAGPRSTFWHAKGYADRTTTAYSAPLRRPTWRRV